MAGSFEQQVSSIAALADPVRNAIYRLIVARGNDVSRDQVAAALNIPRSQATFHLEKLTEQGLLETTYRRLSERRGPGAGRPSKLYRRAGRQFEINLPPREYELAARALAQAVEGRPTGSVKNRLAGVARKIGAEWAAERSSKTPLKNLQSILVRHGYEPYRTGPNAIRLRNCPFEAIAAEHEEAICKVFNLSLIKALIKELGAQGVSAEYSAPPPMCCVSLRFS
ncbi:MAG TPA: helix-turn-helix domain-containing protein [Actinomycetota bacterium]|nr:helix-turn-helix domain-containing protein [Actinomycetota bacterium]